MRILPGILSLTFLAHAGAQQVGQNKPADASENYTLSIVIVALVFGLVTLPCIVVWVLFGTAMRRVLSNPRFVRPFNIAMALLLVASIVPVLTEG